jgi:alpha-galactosidase
MNRREFLAASCAVMAAQLPVTSADAAVEATPFVEALRQGRWRIVLTDGREAGADVARLDRQWDGSLVRLKLTNLSTAPIHVEEVVVFDIEHGLDAATQVYAEGFTMLSQTGGTLAEPVDLGYAERKHYRLPEPENLRTVYGMLMLRGAGRRTLLGFTSCRRFIGRFGFDGKRLRVSVDTEGLALAPGESWELEELLVTTGDDRETLLAELAGRMETHHPRLRHDPPPTGWCSWYWYGPRINVAAITANLDWIAKNLPQLRYIQIDDGYQPIMGDWLETGKAFGGDVRGVLRQIKDRRFEPAIWVAPFIASGNSHLFGQHPDWFVKDDAGKPLRSDRIGFGGWRQGPWYCLDGTHPQAQQYLESLFHTLRNEWGCTYFKLDANYWGAIHGGRHFDPAATRVEAYRRGMQAILRGAGADAFLLGCNHPLWPSLGLIHGSRSSGDINRSWGTFASTARQNLLRAWQNGRLWWNDPDCVLLVDRPPGASTRRRQAEPLTDAQYLFHATAIFAAGGLILDGDDLTRIAPKRLAILSKLLPPLAQSAKFSDESLQVGVTTLSDRVIYSVFNWSDGPAENTIRLPAHCQLKDYWSGQDLGEHEGEYAVHIPAGRSAVLIEATVTGATEHR